MTEPILPDDMANSLIDGTVEASSIPAEFRGVAELFEVAHQPAADAELAGMAAALEMFSAAVAAAAPATVATASTSSNVISMFGTRITKRAALIVGSTLLIAGTAAAAAGGAIPTPFFSTAKDTSTSVTSASVVVTESSVGSTESSVEATEVATTLDSSIVAEDVALCAVTSSSSSSVSSVASSNSVSTSNSVDDKLSTDAGRHGKSVDDFCTEVEHEAAVSGVTVSSIDDHGSGTDTDNGTASSVDTGSGKTGSGKGGSKDTTSSVAGTGTTVATGSDTVDSSGSHKKP